MVWPVPTPLERPATPIGTVLSDIEAAAIHLRQAREEQHTVGCPHWRVSYDAILEAYYCAPCDVWLEPLCDDPTCGFCTPYPLRPSDRR